MNPHIFLLSAEIPGGRVFGLDMQTVTQICVQLLNAGFLAVVLAFILYRPVRRFMAQRTDKINAQLAQAEREMNKAEELKRQYEEKLRYIEAERDEVLELARDVAAEKSKQLMTEAKAEADILRARALTDIQLEQERARDQIRQYIIEASILMAGKIVALSIDHKTENRLFAETMAELEESTWRN